MSLKYEGPRYGEKIIGTATSSHRPSGMVGEQIPRIQHSAAGRMSDAQTSPRRSCRRLPTGIPTLGGTRTWAQDVDRASAKHQCAWPESDMRRAFDAPRAWSSSVSRRRTVRKDLGRSRTPTAGRQRDSGLTKPGSEMSLPLPSVTRTKQSAGAKGRRTREAGGPGRCGGHAGRRDAAPGPWGGRSRTEGEQC